MDSLIQPLELLHATHSVRNGNHAVSEKKLSYTHVLARLDLCLNVGAPVLNLLKQSSTNESDHKITDFQIKMYQSLITSVRALDFGTLIDLHLVGHLFQLLHPLQQLRLRRGQHLQLTPSEVSTGKIPRRGFGIGKPP
jgi:hypothetical protein